MSLMAPSWLLASVSNPPGGEFRQRIARSPEMGGSKRWSKRAAPSPAPGADDGIGHDHRHGADGSGIGEAGEQNAPLAAPSLAV
jgi:hypothetical protein